MSTLWTVGHPLKYFSRTTHVGDFIEGVFSATFFIVVGPRVDDAAAAYVKHPVEQLNPQQRKSD
jgi:hypothetical protein